MSKPSDSATILDVARRAGVSRTTVSRVLNEPDTVSPDTLQRVQEAAAALNYAPNNFARGLRSGRTGVIALLVGDISQPFHGSLAQAVATAAEEHGLGVMLYDLGHSTQRLESVLRKLPRQGVDGVIIATADGISSAAVADAVSEAIAQGVAVVTGVEQFGVEGVAFVSTDHAASPQIALTELTAAGARHPVILLGDRDGPIGRQLVAGAGDATIIEAGYSFERAAEAIDSLSPAHDALIVTTIPMALGAMSALAARGRSLPLIVCEEVPLAAHVTPALTTVAVAPEETGREMVRLLAGLLNGAPVESRTLRPTYTRRDSF